MLVAGLNNKIDAYQAISFSEKANDVLTLGIIHGGSPVAILVVSC